MLLFWACKVCITRWSANLCLAANVLDKCIRDNSYYALFFWTSAESKQKALKKFIRKPVSKHWPKRGLRIFNVFCIALGFLWFIDFKVVVLFFSHIKKYKRKTRWTCWRGNFFSHRCKVVIPNETVTSETFPWFLPRCYLKTEEIIHSRPRLVVLANFITCSSPEIPRDIIFIPSILKFQQRWRISWT